MRQMMQRRHGASVALLVLLAVVIGGLAGCDTTPGVTSGSEALDNLQGDTLPQKPDDIAIIVRPLDIASVIRTP